MSPQSLLDAALAWAASGIPVFPCRPGEKRPATEHGFEDATTDENQIRRWWSENPDYNVAIYPGAADLAVVDLDVPKPEKGKHLDGREEWDKIQKRHGMNGRTYTVQTPSGGRQLYFEGEVPPSVGRLDGRPGVKGSIDTRGQGSYVLVPPSRTEQGVYKVIDRAVPAPLPEWVTAALAKPPEAESSPAQGEPVALDHLIELLKAVDPGCGYETWRDVVGALRATNCMGMTDTLSLAHNWSAGVYHDGPPSNYDGFDVVEKCFDSMPPKVGGVGYGTILHYAREAGYAGPSAVDWREPAAVVFADALVKLPPETPLPETLDRKANRFRPTNDTEWAGIPEQEWAVEGIIPIRQSTVLVAASGHYKTFLALDMAMSVATGVPFAGRPTRKGSAFYAAGEGRHGLRRARAPAWRAVKGITSAPDFYVTHLPRIIFPEEREAFIGEIRKVDPFPVMIVLDTYARAIGGMDENDTKDVGLFTSYADRLLAEFPGVAVVILAHTGKDKSKGYRGSSVLHANTDTLINMESDRERKVVDFHVVQHKDADDDFHLWFHGKPVLDSLYFEAITEAEAKKLVALDDELAGAKVGRALREAGAIGKDKAIVSNKTMAEILKPLQPNQSIDDWQGIVTKTARELGRLAGGRLAAYCEKDGNRTVWFLPA